MITVLGTIGIGIVCGWLTGMIACRGNYSVRNILFLSLANIFTGICIFTLADWLGVFVFSGSVVASLITFLGWAHQLKNHYNTWS